MGSVRKETRSAPMPAAGTLGLVETHTPNRPATATGAPRGSCPPQGMGNSKSPTRRAAGPAARAA
eukprot:11381654-Alexandrium_andersonii.AAC.2